MVELPTLTTARLLLRAPAIADAEEIQRLAGDRAVAETTALIPHPYEDGVAEAWIEDTWRAIAEDKRATFCVVSRATGALIGAISLTYARDHGRAELGYWIGKPYWNQGYATEAADAILGFGFETCGFHRIFAHHFTRNPASGRVMQKIGMRYEGTLRAHALKWGTYEDIAIYGILNEDRG